jgi:hypothetical protein
MIAFCSSAAEIVTISEVVDGPDAAGLDGAEGRWLIPDAWCLGLDIEP